MSEIQDFLREVAHHVAGDTRTLLSAALRKPDAYPGFLAAMHAATPTRDIRAALYWLDREVDRQRKLRAEAERILHALEAELAEDVPNRPKAIALARAYYKLTGRRLTVPDDPKDIEPDAERPRERRGPTYIILPA